MTSDELQELEAMIKLHPKGTHAIFVDEKVEGSWALTGVKILTLISEIRKYRWALEKISGDSCLYEGICVVDTVKLVCPECTAKEALGE